MLYRSRDQPALDWYLKSLRIVEKKDTDVVVEQLRAVLHSNLSQVALVFGKWGIAAEHDRRAASHCNLRT